MSGVQMFLYLKEHYGVLEYFRCPINDTLPSSAVSAPTTKKKQKRPHWNSKAGTVADIDEQAYVYIYTLHYATVKMMVKWQYEQDMGYVCLPHSTFTIAGWVDRRTHNDERNSYRKRYGFASL